MWFLIAWIIGDLVGFASAWFLAHGLGYRKGYAAGLKAAQIPTQRQGEVNLGPKRRLIPVAVSGCDDRSGGSQGSGPLADHNPEPVEEPSIHVYFMHETLTPENVRATWDLPEMPTVGEVIEFPGAGYMGADAVWRVVRVAQHSADVATCYVTDAPETPGTGSADPDGGQ